MEHKKRQILWGDLFLVTFLITYLYVFNDWLFAVTRVSQMSTLGLIHQLRIFLSTSALLTSVQFLILLPLVLLSRLPSLRSHTGWLINTGRLLPAGMAAALILILVDNFTYTLFQWGIVSTEGWIRALYGLVFLVVLTLSYRHTLKILSRLGRQNKKGAVASRRVYSLLAIVLTLSLASLGASSLADAASIRTNSAVVAEDRPHILLITADGVEANHLSVYGYGQETSPRLEELAKSSLVAENAFPNAGNTTGSVISIYTGKYPAATRVIYPPDILKGQDAYEHLPGLLRAQGYRSVQITLPYYLDPASRNILSAFDEVFTNRGSNSQYLNTLRIFLPNDDALFVDKILNRIVDRVRHIFFINKMTNPYLLVRGLTEPLADTTRLAQLQYELRSSEGPLFVHVHMMGTHGELYNPAEQVFSAGQKIEEQEPWNTDFYDDSIREFDQRAGELIDTLIDLDLLDRTILIIGSDHGQQFQLERVPLIIRFPHGQYVGRLRFNVQNLDIAPTVLDYLGLDQPGWMPGISLIAGELEPRPIFSINEATREKGLDSFLAVNWDKVEPPFYQFDAISVMYCQWWYRLDLKSLVWEIGQIEGSTEICPQGSEISDEQAFEWIVGHLDEYGFNVSTLAIESIKSQDD